MDIDLWSEQGAGVPGARVHYTRGYGYTSGQKTEIVRVQRRRGVFLPEKGHQILFLKKLW